MSVPRPVLVTALLAALVTVGALVTAFVLRPEAGGGIPEPSVDAAESVGAADCGAEPCQVLASTEVGGLRMELLADGNGGTGRLRAGGSAAGIVAETAITAMGVQLTSDSLDCVAAADPVCLVRGPLDGGMVGEVQVWRDGSWRAAERPYFSDAGSIGLDDVAGDGAPEVIVVRHECSQVESATACQEAPVLAEVLDLRGALLGCTYQYESPDELRGWPEVRLRESDLRECP
ncbi:hypothetical protein [Qaidamihabitans albus]|uniref:hypothetical protein n=1 Tax=Qaidamihabitans albus TaxID=2795733 RepID=UPI001B356689|nr:hypothetical protein [Qaidamihabitans albus]